LITRRSFSSYKKSSPLHTLTSLDEAMEFGADAWADSEDTMVQVPETLLTQLLQTEAMYIGSNEVGQLTLREVLDTLNPLMAAKFIHMELPKRLAVRTRMIEKLVGWQQIPEFVEAHEQLNRWYRDLRLVRRDKEVGLQDFVKTIRKVKTEGRGMVVLCVTGMHKLHSAKHTNMSEAYVDSWLDDYLMLRIGTNTLMDQCVAIAAKEDGGYGRPQGIVDPKCDAGKICRQAAEYASTLCQVHMGKKPAYTIDTFVSDDEGFPVDQPAQFSYVPSHLRYIMIELLKNAFRATIERSADEAEVQSRPVHILVSFDPSHCAIRVSDRAGGIPLKIQKSMFSYLYGAAARRHSNATSLAGWGVGLPISRLHARYLGGKLTVCSYPGHGTDCSLTLPSIASGQVETVPLH